MNLLCTLKLFKLLQDYYAEQQMQSVYMAKIKEET